MVIALGGSVCCEGESETMQNKARRITMKYTYEKVLHCEICEKLYLCCDIRQNSTFSKVTMRKIIGRSIIYQNQNNKIPMKKQYIQNSWGNILQNKCYIRMKTE